MKITIGALAHVDAGKTTLSEAILYKTNVIRNKGRVDNKDSFLDFSAIEKEKGITVYNAQANFKYKDKDFIYLDTPGHNDLAYESSRAINVLDCAILLISSIEDIPLDTINKFNNLLNYSIPIIIFVNKMDIANYTKEEILLKLQSKLSKDCIEYTSTNEFISLTSDSLLEEYLKTDIIPKQTIIDELKKHTFFPVFFGSALKDQGIDNLLDYICEYVAADYDETKNFNAYLYKIYNDYSYIKILSGFLTNKTIIGENKINEIYDVNGNNFTSISKAIAGDIVAVKGLKDVPIGTYLPSFENDDLYNVPSLTYRIISSLDSNELYRKLENICNEFPELNITLDNNNVFVNLNGELHALIIKKMFKERLAIDVDFSDPIIKYKETVSTSTYGVGHFEPLRHYAEAIVEIKPYEKDIKIDSKIDNSYTNTILSYLRNYTLRGILTNSPLTNIEITLVDIKTHPKHTEGGDLLQATRRAIRQGLSKTNLTLLEPFYLTCIKTNDSNLNDIISFLTSYKCPYTIHEDSLVCKISLKQFNNIIIGLKSRLKGQLDFSIEEIIYDECENALEVIENRNYDYRSDMRNPAGSIFCKSGAGHYVEPEDVEDNMHLNLSDYFKDESNIKITHNKVKISDEELNRVINSLYKPKPRYIEKHALDYKETEYHKMIMNKPLIYLIDGYNLMYYMDEDNAIANIISARENIINLVCDFAGYVAAETILVFDAYKTDSHSNEIIKQDNINIVYTKHKQSADNYIENKSKELAKDYRVIVVTSDNMEQMHIFANSASRISSREFINRYNNLRKNNTKLNDVVRFKQLEDIKKLLQD